jgi:tetratricopeptide (TPR) repeat protein
MWQARPVFISSTFVDMQAERDYMRTRVFPDLEERLRGRRRNLEWVDLRVGVATATQRDEQARELHVLKVCLDEVRRCRPFLIVLVGDRYGWVPPEDRIRAAAAEEGFSEDVAGRSVTDLEIDFGVLSDPQQQPRSVFYFREPLPYAAMTAEVAAAYCEDYATDSAKADRVQRLAALKRRIEQQLPTRVRHYAAQWDAAHQRVTGLEAWGRMVLDDIWSELEVETRASAAVADVPWQQVERESLEDFVDDRARDFVGRRDILGRLIGLAAAAENAGPAWGACVIGDPGSGKSALFGELDRHLGASDVFLLAHAAGASPQAASVDAMLRRWIGELATALDIREVGLAENTDAETVEATFVRLLGQMASKRRAVVLVDALDQFENTTRGRYATWLPRLWPANARLIATAIGGDSAKTLTERPGVDALPLPPLDAAEARGIIEGICGRYHRTFEPQVIDALLAKTGVHGPVWGNPLWLVIAVEELNLLDADDFAHAQRDYTGEPAERLLDLMLDKIVSFPNDIPGLYCHTFERAEELFGVSLARGFLGLIAVGRAGWRESDFRILLPQASGENWDELKFAQLRRIFRGQLRRRGALIRWDFNHGQMRDAVCARLPERSVPVQNLYTARDLHIMIADRLLSCPPSDPLHIEETMVHLLASQDYVRAAGYYGEPSLSEPEELAATRVLADSVIAPTTGTPKMAARDICRLLEISDDFIANIVAQRFLFRLTSTIEQKADLDARFIVATSTKQAFERSLDAHPQYATSWQENLAFCHVQIGSIQTPRGDLEGALHSYRSAIAITETLTRVDPLNVKLQRDLANLSAMAAGLLVTQGKVADALRSYHDSLAITGRLAKALPADTALCHDLATTQSKIGEVLLTQGHLQEAVKSFSDSDAGFERLAALNPDFTGLRRSRALHYLKVGEVLFAQHNLPEALNCFRTYNAICDQLSAQDPADTLLRRDLMVSFDKLGMALLVQDNLAEALKAYQNGLAIIGQLAHADPHNTDWERDLSISYFSIGDIQIDQRDLPAALSSFYHALAIAARLATSNPDNAVWQRHLSLCHLKIGGVQEAQRGFVDALHSYRAASTVLEQLSSSDPKNTQWQEDLAASYNRIGGVLQALGDVAGALKSHRDSLSIAQQLVKFDSVNPIWERDLIMSCVSVSALDRENARELLMRAAEGAHNMRSKGTLLAKDAWIPDDLARRIAALDS